MTEKLKAVETVKNAGNVNVTNDYVKTTVVKDGVKCLALFLGHEDYTRVDEETGDLKYSYAYTFLRFDGKMANGQFVAPEVVKYYEKSTDHDYLRHTKPMEYVGLSVTISQMGKNLFTSVKSILNDDKTNALKEIYDIK